MRFLIQFDDDKTEGVREFGVLEEGEDATDRPEDDKIFYWLTKEEARQIGEDFDGGDWVVLRCACDDCESEQE
jgi:hypothetical protein